MTNYLSLAPKLVQARNHCQAIVDKANSTGWTEQLENAFMVAQKLEIFLSKQLTQ